MIPRTAALATVLLCSLVQACVHEDSAPVTPETDVPEAAAIDDEPPTTGPASPTDTDLPSGPCGGEVCGENAICDTNTATCVCVESYVGDPIEGCEPVPAHLGWIGSPCSDLDACPYEDAICWTADDGYPEGHCTQTCDRFCPDQADAPVTFCIEPQWPDGGHCFARCDMVQYPQTAGCRSGYACTDWGRFGEASRTELVCVPDAWVTPDPCSHPTNFDDSEACYFELVSFGNPELEDLTRMLLDGTATSVEAEAFLDLNHELSQTFVTSTFGVTLHENRTPGHSAGSPMVGAIVHYTAAAREDGTIRYFVSADPHASTHFIIGSYRNGLIVQLFSHRDRTWHAGSTYNIDRFGIDFANAGFLRPDGVGGWETYSGATYDLVLPGHGAQPVEVTEGIPHAPENKYTLDAYWQPYTYYQLLSYVAVMRALHLVYGLEPADVARHGDVSASRVDPGPALPLTWLNDLVFDDRHVTTTPWLQDYRSEPGWISQHVDAR